MDRGRIKAVLFIVVFLLVLAVSVNLLMDLQQKQGSPLLRENLREVQQCRLVGQHLQEIPLPVLLKILLSVQVQVRNRHLHLCLRLLLLLHQKEILPLVRERHRLLLLEAHLHVSYRMLLSLCQKRMNLQMSRLFHWKIMNTASINE